MDIPTKQEMQKKHREHMSKRYASITIISIAMRICIRLFICLFVYVCITVTLFSWRLIYPGSYHAVVDVLHLSRFMLLMAHVYCI